MKVLILDDEPYRHKLFRLHLAAEERTHVMTADECIDALREEKWDIVFLDHDLGGMQMVVSMSDTGEKTGYQVACFLEEFPIYKPTKVIVHSLNPAGAKNMCAAVYGAVHIPINKLFLPDIYDNIARV